MPISFVAAGTEASGTSGTTVAPALPAGIANDDILIVVADCWNGNAVGSMGADWTRIVELSGNTNYPSFAVFWRRYDGTDPSRTVTFSGSSGDGKIAAICAFRGCKTIGSPFNVTPTSANGTDNTIEHGPLTTDKDGCYLVCLNGTDGSDARTSLASGFTNVFEDTAGGTDNAYRQTEASIHASYKDQGAQGATGTLVVSGSAIPGWASSLLALEPAVTSSTIDQSVTVACSTAVNFVKGAQKRFTGTCASAATIVRSVSKKIAATCTDTVTHIKSAAKAVTAAASTSVAVAASRLFLASISVTCSSATTFARSVGKTVTALCNSIASQSRVLAFVKAISVTCSSSVTLLKSISFVIDVAALGSLAAARIVVKGFEASLTGDAAVNASRAFLKAISITSAASVDLLRGVAKSVSATCMVAANVLSQKLAEIIDVTIDVAVSASVAFGKTISTATNTALSASVVATRFIAKGVSAAISGAVSTIKAVTRVVSVAVPTSVATLKSIGLSVSAAIGSTVEAIADLAAIIHQVAISTAVGLQSVLRRSVGKSVAASSAASTVVKKIVFITSQVVASCVLSIRKTVGVFLGDSISALSEVWPSASFIRSAIDTARVFLTRFEPRNLRSSKEDRVISLAADSKMAATRPERRTVIAPKENRFLTLLANVRSAITGG